VAVGLLVWTLTGAVLFSHMIRLHPRYVEGFVPAVAALLGIGIAWAGSPASPERDFPRLRLGALTVALLVTVFYVERLEYGLTAVWWVSLATALIALGLALFAYAGRGPARLLSIGVISFTLVAVLALPLRADIAAIHDDVSDAGYVGGIPTQQLDAISSYLQAHRDGAHYEVAASSATAIGALIVKDVQPVVILTTYDARVFTTVAQLKRLIAAGKVRYAFLNTFCTAEPDLYTTNAGCSAPVRWIRAHGTDVSLRAGLTQGGLLYLLPGARQ